MSLTVCRLGTTETTITLTSETFLGEFWITLNLVHFNVFLCMMGLSLIGRVKQSLHLISFSPTTAPMPVAADMNFKLNMESFTVFTSDCRGLCNLRLMQKALVCKVPLWRVCLSMFVGVCSEWPLLRFVLRAVLQANLYLALLRSRGCGGGCGLCAWSTQKKGQGHAYLRTHSCTAL